jgi:hypothetical protein
MKRNNIKTFIACALLFVVVAHQNVVGQNSKSDKYKALLQSQPKWTVFEVKSRKPEFEVGETLKFRVDGNFYYEQNNYAKRGGEWLITKNELILVFDSFTEKRKKIPTNYTVKKLKNGNMVLKYRNSNRKSEKIYFK